MIEYNKRMLDKIKTIHKHPQVGRVARQVKDIRIIGFAAFAVLVLLVSWSTVTVIQTNYDLQKQVSKIEQQNKVSELQNNNLKLRNQYYNTDQYQELTARRQFGKAAPGEKVLLVPKNVALAHTVDLPKNDAQFNTAPAKPFYQQNFNTWMDFFFHRQR